MEKETNLKYLLNIQYFADDSGSSGEEGQVGDEESDEENESNGNEGEEGTDEKKFTQKELNEIGSKNKKAGRRAILKALGFKSEEEAKNFVSKYKQQSNEESNDSDKLAEAEAKATLAENKLTLLSAGVPKENFDDVLAIATLKMSDDKDLEEVVEEMKKDAKYKSLFGLNGASDSGTGSSTKSGKKNNNAQTTIGQRLGKANKRQASKNSWFE